MAQMDNMDIERKIIALLDEMTLEEKALQIDQYSAADFCDTDESGRRIFSPSKILSHMGDGKAAIGLIQDNTANPALLNEMQAYILENSRVKIPVLFSAEGLHGVAVPGSTIFPQQLCLGSTFNPELAYKTGCAIAAEARAYGIHEVWAPVLDLARDPRWGRTEETFGEDTYLSATLGERFVCGMQGGNLSDPRAVISEPKHFTAYGLPYGGINCAPAAIGKRDMYTNCMPVFEAAFSKAGAANTMCSYSSVDGIPCSGDHELLTEVLRNQWGMRGFVRSDMCAISMLNHDHNVASTREEAVIMALEAGCDVQLYDFPHAFYQGTIIKSVKDGRLSIEVLNRAVARVLRMKFLLGLFDNAYVDEDRVSYTIRCPEHTQLAERVAEEGICLLKNDGLLPLGKDTRRIAVIGPSAKTPRVGDYSSDWRGHFEPVTIWDGIEQALSDSVELTYSQGCNISDYHIQTVPTRWLSYEGEAGLKGEYFNGDTFDGAPMLTRIDPHVNFCWIYQPPCAGIDAQIYRVRWSGKLTPDVTGRIMLGFSCMDSFRLYIDGALFVDGWECYKDMNTLAAIDVKQGQSYDIVVEFKNDHRAARVVFGYSEVVDYMDEAVRIAKEADVAIVCLGDADETSGENLDRADLNLPAQQFALLKAVADTGTPVILALQIGRPMSITWEYAHLDAILCCWFAGEQAGTAIARIILGDVNPSGKLPISFPKSVGQLPVHYNRKPAGGTRYIEMDTMPLFPFGYGLSYTSFELSNARLHQSEISLEAVEKGETVTVTCDVTNIGDRAGAQVVQLYLTDKFASVVRNRKDLRGYEKVYLEKGETKCVTFALGDEHMRVFDKSFEWHTEKGEFVVSLGFDSDTVLFSDNFFVV